MVTTGLIALTAGFGTATPLLDILHGLAGSLIISTLITAVYQFCLRVLLFAHPKEKKVASEETVPLKHEVSYTLDPDPNHDDRNRLYAERHRGRFSFKAALGMIVGGFLWHVVHIVVACGAQQGCEWFMLWVFYFPTIVLIGWGLKSLVPLNNVFPVVIALFFITERALVVVGGIGRSKSIHYENTRLFEPPGTNITWGVDLHNAYPVCKTSWGGEQINGEKGDMEHRLGILDIGVLCDAVYADDQTHHDEMLHMAQASFNGTDLEDVELEDYERDFNKVGRWAIFKIPSAKTRVMAIRGTVTAADKMADADLFSFAFLINMLDRFVPIHG